MLQPKQKENQKIMASILNEKTRTNDTITIQTDTDTTPRVPAESVNLCQDSQ